MNAFKVIQIYILFSLCCGCGFHLAGGGDFADELSNTHVQRVSSSKDMSRLLEKSLRANQINIVEAENATAVVRILSDETEKAVVTLDSDGKAREFELFLRVTFDVINAEKKELLGKQFIKLDRNFVFDKNNLLGANEEEQKLLQEMRKDAARLIVYRLQNF